MISTFAGNGVTGFGGDGGPANQATLYSPFGVAVGPDGSLYIADGNNNTIRRVGADGIIRTVAGGGSPPDGLGDHGPATLASLNGPSAVAVGLDGALYIADTNHSRVRRVSPDGVITTIAGIGGFGYSGDGALAAQAALFGPEGVAVGRDGSLYIADTFNSRVRLVDTNGIITTIAGNAVRGFGGEEGPATQASINNPYGVSTGPDGSLYIADTGNNRIRRIVSPLPGFSSTDAMIPSEDGRELYAFDGSGRHLRTLDALTGTIRFQFGYDAVGRLMTAADGDGNVTTIERDVDGNPTGIVGPFGQRTTLTVDANGSLAGVTNPANETVGFTSTPEGLLTSLIEPKGGVHSFSYDALGRLIRDTDPAGGSAALSRIDGATSSP